MTHGMHAVKDFLRGVADRQAPGDGRTAHALRHSCANHLMDMGATTEQVQQALRHRSIRSTEVYTRGRVEPLREVMAGRSYLP